MLAEELIEIAKTNWPQLFKAGLNGAIHSINHYPLDKCYKNLYTTFMNGDTYYYPFLFMLIRPTGLTLVEIFF